MWILIRWLWQNPDDRNLHCFQKKVNLDSAGQGLRVFRLNSFPFVVCMITCVKKSLDPDQAGQNIRPDLHSICLTILFLNRYL